MKTNHASRIARVLLLLMMFAIVIASFASCNKDQKIVDKEVYNVPKILYVKEFDPEMNNIREAIDACNIVIRVVYEDGTSEEIQFKFDMIDDAIKARLNKPGKHYIDYGYKGENIHLEIQIDLLPAYTVRFYDVHNNVISEQRVNRSQDAVEPTEAERAVPGYEFIEWDKSFSNVVRDLDVYGIYEESVYTVRFYDHNNKVISEQTLGYGESAVAPSDEDMVIEGREFVGWDAEFDNVTGDLDVHPVYDDIHYTVRFFDLNNDLISEQSVKHGDAAVEPTEAERSVDGYAFLAWDAEFSSIEGDLDVYGIYEKLYVVNFYNSKNVLIDTQYVPYGGDAQSPSDAAIYVPGYILLRWDAEFTNIQQDTDIYGIYINDDVTDTDGDGIIDYIEIEILGLDYTKVDTDGNGITDDKEDSDGDGLANLTEINTFLDPANPDSDGDGLSDGDEVDIYWTLPADPDSDGDGANDGWEVSNGFDPLIYNASFEVETKVEMPGNTEVTIEIPELPGELVGTTIIEASEDESIKDVHGSLGEAIQYNVSASATITIASEELQTAEDPVLMYFNTETKQVEPITVSVSGNEATASIDKYGSYVLVDRKVFEEKGQWRDVYTSGNYTSIEIVFVIDDSGSMGPVGSNNDPQNKRLSVARDLIDKLPNGAKIGVVRFDDYATALTSSLTTSKDTAKGYLTTSYFNSVGSTLMYSGAMTGLNLYSDKQTSGDVLRVMILISDGIPSFDSYTQDWVINTANSKGVQIYTVGLGNNESYFNDTLRPLANGTNASFSYSSNASGLASIYEKIGEKIDMTLDSDEDGLADFFESGVDANSNPTLPTINGMSFEGLNKNDPDTDKDGYLDGQEIEIYQYYSDRNPNQVMIWGIVHSDPTDPESIPAA